VVNQKVLELSKKQNLEELLSAIKPHLTGGSKEGIGLTVYYMDADGRPEDPANGWLIRIEEKHINVSCGVDSYHTVPFTMNEKADGYMIVKVETNLPRETIYKHPEGWEFYEVAVNQTAKEAAAQAEKSTRERYLKA
jgi:hypothetical protein